MRRPRLNRPRDGYPWSATENHVKEDAMYVSIGTVLAIVLIIALLAWLL
jgi:hypothetical protein